MASKEFIDDIIRHVKDSKSKINFNKALFEITEGDLLKYVWKTLEEQLSPDAAQKAFERASPINVWNKIVRKLSRLYAKPVTRTTDNPADLEIVQYYEGRGIDKHFGNMNENYNSYKWTDLEIYEDPEDRNLHFRSNPSHQFLAYSDNKINPLKPTAIIKFMGEQTDVEGVTKNKLWIYTEDEFIAVLDDGTLVPEDMLENEGINPYGVIPFEYIKMSEYLLTPNPDQDSLQMTKLIPVLITDQNYGSMYLSFPILYTVDADSENLPASPNIFWNLKGDDEKTPQVGVVKAEPDLKAQMEHTISQLAIWLDSRDIKPGTVGKLNAENFASGVSKVISEMDTLENRKNQEIIFREMEVKFWKRLATMHNKLVEAGRIDIREKFSNPQTLRVNITYSEESIIETRADKVARLKLEHEAGFISKSRAIGELNPGMNEGKVADEMAQIEDEKKLSIAAPEEGEDFGGTTED